MDLEKLMNAQPDKPGPPKRCVLRAEPAKCGSIALPRRHRGTNDNLLERNRKCEEIFPLNHLEPCEKHKNSTEQCNPIDQLESPAGTKPKETTELCGTCKRFNYRKSRPEGTNGSGEEEEEEGEA